MSTTDKCVGVLAGEQVILAPNTLVLRIKPGVQLPAGAIVLESMIDRRPWWKRWLRLL